MNLREIAKRANVSVATVSRTMNCAPNLDPISGEARAKGD